jgi:hypothetical protein
MIELRTDLVDQEDESSVEWVNRLRIELEVQDAESSILLKLL